MFVLVARRCLVVVCLYVIRRGGGERDTFISICTRTRIQRVVVFPAPTPLNTQNTQKEPKPTAQRGIMAFIDGIEGITFNPFYHYCGYYYLPPLGTVLTAPSLNPN